MTVDFTLAEGTSSVHDTEMLLGLHGKLVTPRFYVAIPPTQTTSASLAVKNQPDHTTVTINVVELYNDQ